MLVSDCCYSEMIEPDWDMVENAGSLWRAYACYICKSCGKPCKEINKPKNKTTMLKTQAIGHLGNDAVVNNVNGKNVINFSLAHSEKYKNAEGIDVNRTVWVSCAYWTDKLNVANYLKKGTQVYVEGQPSVKTYQDKESRTQAQLTLRVSSIQLLGGKQEGNTQQSQPQNAPSSYNTPQDTAEPVDDLPF